MIVSVILVTVYAADLKQYAGDLKQQDDINEMNSRLFWDTIHQLQHEKSATTITNRFDESHNTVDVIMKAL